MKSSTGEVNRISSNQLGIHENLCELVAKYAVSGFRKPVAAHTQSAFDKVQLAIAKENKPIILDSGCGTAMSTSQIAKQYSDSWVIGVDRSIARLEKQVDLPANAMAIQADLVDFWRLAVKAQWQLERHYILYPNPYPKASQLKRRWHAHPVFADLLRLGGHLELRTNWKIYADEFACALGELGHQSVRVELFEPIDYWTLFEKKYHEAGQDLYCCTVSL